MAEDEVLGSFEEQVMLAVIRMGTRAYTLRDEEVFQRLKPDGTVETPEEETRAYVDLGVDGFFTDSPDTGRAVVDAAIEEQGGQPVPATGPSSSASPYLVPTAAGVSFTSLITFQRMVAEQIYTVVQYVYDGDTLLEEEITADCYHHFHVLPKDSAVDHAVTLIDQDEVAGEDGEPITLRMSAIKEHAELGAVLSDTRALTVAYRGRS